MKKEKFRISFVWSIIEVFLRLKKATYWQQRMIIEMEKKYIKSKQPFNFYHDQ